MSLIDTIAQAFPGEKKDLALTITGAGALPSCFAVSDLAVAAVGVAASKLARLATPEDEPPPDVAVDRRLASLWFDMTLRPTGWQMPSPWDPVAGDYRTADGWIRLHTNAPHHRRAALSVLGPASDRKALEPLVAAWKAEELETAIVAAGGCAAQMHSLQGWAAHPQGLAVAREPLIDWKDHGAGEAAKRSQTQGRPLEGIRVLDLTRVLAGPVAGRFLAAYGADVLRIDPPDWDEPGVVPEVTLGKRCAGLDLKSAEDRLRFENLLAKADVFLHGYRPGALDNLGYPQEARRHINPRLIDVCLNAYGWSGPWSGRRGFDSLVQMSSGIADHGMKANDADKPVPLPVQALDHATGYLLAAAVLHALHDRDVSGRVASARLSLARMAHLLSTTKLAAPAGSMAPETPDDLDPTIEKTDWGPARRVRFPLKIGGIDHAWDTPAGQLRAAEPAWRDRS
ncbi:CoA transferase [Hoeflea poritis]|uniref:CoA transferase n=1 Tax=Hoeflea poritis TaxID=2993659 RepID=A0ABT4VJM8_9HYPH|nr:CoA transferase [Hoeflea poritis]MDA4844903.1 CoA transferase [Hoeflea poritis]